MKSKSRLFRMMFFSMGLLYLLSIDVNAIDGNIDLTYRSIVRTLSGRNKDTFNSAIETNDKELIVVGTSYGADSRFDTKGAQDAVIVKYDSKGNQQWIKSFGGSENDIFNSVIETKNKELIVVGESRSTNAGFNNNGVNDAIIVKYDSNGNQLWVKNFGGSSSDCFNSVIEVTDGFVAVGYSSSTNAGFFNRGSSDAVIVKYDSNGNQQWVKNYGGSSTDYFKSVTETSDGNIVAVGYTYSSDLEITTKGGCDAFIIKYKSTNGYQQWVKGFGGSKADFFNSVIETDDKGIVVVGHSNSTDAGFTNKGQYDGIIVKYDENGNQLWVRNFGGTSDDSFYSITKTQNEEFIVCGDSMSSGLGVINKGIYDAIVVKYDKSGNQQWVKNFGGFDFDHFYNITTTHNGGFVAVGESFSSDAGFENKGNYDAVIVKYNSACKEFEEVFDNIKNLEANKDNVELVTKVVDEVNKIHDKEVKNYLKEKLKNLNIDVDIKLETATANIDVYIEYDSALKMTLDTNSITFKDFSSVKDMEKPNAIKLVISSGLPYQLNAYLPVEIQNADKTSVMDKRILNIKENSETNYKVFTNINEKLILKDNCPAGEDLMHGIDIRLKGGITYKEDVYKTTIKFEAEQK